MLFIEKTSACSALFQIRGESPYMAAPAVAAAELPVTIRAARCRLYTPAAVIMAHMRLTRYALFSPSDAKSHIARLAHATNSGYPGGCAGPQLQAAAMTSPESPPVIDGDSVR